MKINLFECLKKTGESLKKRPWVFVIGVCLFLIVQALSFLSISVNELLAQMIGAQASQTTQILVLGGWLLIYTAINFLFLAGIFAGLIGFLDSKRFFSSIKKYSFKNFLVLIAIACVYIAVWAIAQYGANFVGKGLGFDLETAIILFFILYFAGFFGILIFFSFSHFYVVLKNRSVSESVKDSWRFVRRHYVFVVCASIVLYLVSFGLGRIPELAGSFIEYAILIPVLAAFMVQLVKEEK